MARLLSPEGEEVCYLVHLVIDGVSFAAEVAFYVDFGEALGDAILEADGAHYRVRVDAWEVGVENGYRIRRVRGRLVAEGG